MIVTDEIQHFFTILVHQPPHIFIAIVGGIPAAIVLIVACIVVWAEPKR